MRERGRGRARSGILCGTCHLEMPPEFWSGRGPAPKPVHCMGSAVAWQSSCREAPHHGRLRYPPCWRCQESLGCDQCAGALDDVLCLRCAAWGTRAAFAQHGPMLNTAPMVGKRKGARAPEFAEYPPSFQARYRDTRACEARNEPWKPKPRLAEGPVGIEHGIVRELFE